MFQGQHSNGNSASSPTVVDDDDGKEERVGSFGDRFRKSWQRLSLSVSISSNTSTSGAEQAAADHNVDDDNGITDLLDEVDQNGGLSILLRRADKISLSYYSPSPMSDDATRILSEFELISTDTEHIVINGINDQDGFLSHHINSCCSLEGSQQSSTFMKVGDVVEYACGIDCRRGYFVFCHEFGAADLNGNTDATTGATTDANTLANINVFDKIEETKHIISDTTVLVSTTNSFKEPIRFCQSTVLFSKKEIMDEITAIQMKNFNAGRAGSMSCLDVGISFSQQNDRLTIGSISKSESSWFRSSGCAIREGDIVVGINEFVASKLSPQDATSFIHDILSSPKSCHLSIMVIATPRLTQSTRWGTIRKAAVTAGGGTLVASGAILMATPLHPVGHAMALGGMGILGTEYEAPRKVMNSAKERLSETRQSWNEKKMLRKASAESNCRSRSRSTGSGA